MLKLSSNVSDVFLKVLNLSSEVDECKPLSSGFGGGGGGGRRRWTEVAPAAAADHMVKPELAPAAAAPAAAQDHMAEWFLQGVPPNPASAPDWFLQHLPPSPAPPALTLPIAGELGRASSAPSLPGAAPVGTSRWGGGLLKALSAGELGAPHTGPSAGFSGLGDPRLAHPANVGGAGMNEVGSETITHATSWLMGAGQKPGASSYGCTRKCRCRTPPLPPPHSPSRYVHPMTQAGQGESWSRRMHVSPRLLPPPPWC